jgi:hypothetical protein
MVGREDELGEEKTRRCVRVTESIEGNGGRDEGGDDALITPTTAPTRHSRPAVMTNEDPAVEVVFTAMTPFFRCIFPLRLLFRRMALRRPNFRRLSGRRLPPPLGCYRSPLPLLCCPFLRRSRWRAVSRRPGRGPTLRSAFRALPDHPKSGSPCRLCRRPPYPRGCGQPVPSGPLPVGQDLKETSATMMIVAQGSRVKPSGKSRNTGLAAQDGGILPRDLVSVGIPRGTRGPRRSAQRKREGYSSA